MNKYEKNWEPVYSEFEYNYPTVAEQVIGWYPSGRNQITVTLDDWTKYIYEWTSKQLYKLHPDNELHVCETEDEWRTVFARNLTNKMRKFGVSQNGMCDRTGISQVTMSNYMTGRSIPSAYNLYKIACALRCTTTDLLDEVEEIKG